MLICGMTVMDGSYHVEIWRSGRPKKTTPREDRILKRVVPQQLFLSLAGS